MVLAGLGWEPQDAWSPWPSPSGLAGPTFPLRVPVISGEWPALLQHDSYIIRATYLLEVPRWSSGWHFVLSLQGACVPSQVGGLRSCMLVSQKKKKRERKTKNCLFPNKTMV